MVRYSRRPGYSHYMAIEETPRDNELYVTYDLGGSSKRMRRDVMGRSLKVTIDPEQA